MEKKFDKRDRLRVLSLFSYRVNYQLSLDYLSSRFHIHYLATYWPGQSV